MENGEQETGSGELPCSGGDADSGELSGPDVGSGELPCSGRDTNAGELSGAGHETRSGEAQSLPGDSRSMRARATGKL